MASSTRAETRRRAGYTIVGLARRTGISTTRISMWERFQCRLKDSEVASVAAALVEGLDRTPKSSEVEFLMEGADGR
jgi:transcriptional regulator with XRE-family HTH domain